MKTRPLISVMSITATAMFGGCANTGYQPVSSSSLSNAYSATRY